MQFKYKRFLSVKKYLLYGSSIIIGRGLEYVVLLFAAHYLTKTAYGDLEFYKKIIELATVFLTFGFPTLILSYTKSKESKRYFTLISLIFVLALSILFLPLFYFSGYLIILVPLCFAAICFNNGILPPFILVSYGSNVASYYKIIISILFYSLTFAFVFSSKPEFSFVYTGYILLPITLVFIVLKRKMFPIKYGVLLKYWKLFKAMLLRSFTLVLSNFANIAFLYTDILIIKFLSEEPNIEIADYSFSLNIANALILVPMTMVQVDIEKLKLNKKYLNTLNYRIIALVLLGSLGLIGLFLILTSSFFENYEATFYLFLTILTAKIFQAISVSFGTTAIIKKMYTKNLVINLFVLSLNVILSYFLYQKIELVGVAIASGISLIIRYILLIYINKK